MTKRYFILSHDQARQNALEAVKTAPEGHCVTVAEPSRSGEQNAAQWPILAAFSQQLQWPVNGERTWLSPEEWKDLLTAAIRYAGRTPCEKFHCRLSDRCAAERLACASFAFYVVSGRALHPNSDPMNRKANNQAHWSENPVPSREIFDSLDSEAWEPRIVVHRIDIAGPEPEPYAGG